MPSKWVTRERPKIDRIACPWLIRRFIAEDAEFIYVPTEQVFAAAMIPVVNPATVQEYLDYGILGFALSRYSGCWIGFKAISETVESGASVWVDPERSRIIMPTDFQLPPGGLGIRHNDPPMEQERRLHGPKMDAVKAFVRANGFDRVVIDPPAACIGIMTTGKAYLDTR